MGEVINYIHVKQYYVITHPWPNCCYTTVNGKAWLSKNTSQITNVNYLPYLNRSQKTIVNGALDIEVVSYVCGVLLLLSHTAFMWQTPSL